MRVKHRLIGGYITLGLFVASLIVLLIQPMTDDYWDLVKYPAIFVSAFIGGVLIYIRSMKQEMKRLQHEKEKQKKK